MKQVFLLSIGICLSALGFSSRVYLDDSLRSIIDVGEPSYFITSNLELNLADVMLISFEDSPNEVRQLLKKNNNSRAFWVRIPVRKRVSTDYPISLRTFLLSEMTVYQVLASEIDSTKNGLFDISTVYSHERDMRVVDLIPFAKSEELVLYIKIRHSRGMQVPRRLWFNFANPEQLQEDYKEQIKGKTLENYFYAFFCGLLVFQLLYVLLQWYLVRKREYSNYSAYILCVFIYFFARFSVFNATDEAIALIDARTMAFVNGPLLVLPSFFYFRFSRFFVDLKTRDPLLNRQMKWFELLLLFCFLTVIALYVFPNDIDKSIPVFVALISQIPFGLYTLIRIAKQKRVIAYFLVAASSFALISHLLANFLPLIYPPIYNIVLPLQITMTGILIELGLFNTGLLFKARESESQKVEAQNALLEESTERRKLQDEYYQIRDKISGDLHDDLGSSLSSIQIYGFAARQKLGEEDTAQTLKLLSNIERTSESMLNSMSDMIWAINPQNDTNEKLIERIQAFSYDILAACNCQFTIDVDPEFYSLKLNQAERRNVLLLIKEAVNNAAKYSEAQKVDLVISKTSSHYIFRVSDDGKGIGAEIAEGNGMRTMRKRAEELSGFFELKSDKSGTSISFKI